MHNINGIKFMVMPVNTEKEFYNIEQMNLIKYINNLKLEENILSVIKDLNQTTTTNNKITPKASMGRMMTLNLPPRSRVRHGWDTFTICI
jgi:hypothetical protein